VSRSLHIPPWEEGSLLVRSKKEDLSPTDMRLRQPRFQEGAYEANLKFVNALTKISERKGISNAKLCIAWVASLGAHVIPLPGSSAAKRTLENFSAASVELSEEDIKEINDAIANFEIQGTRYAAGMPIWG